MQRTWPILLVCFAAGVILAFYQAWVMVLLSLALLFLAAIPWEEERVRLLLAALLLLAGTARFQYGRLPLPAHLHPEPNLEISGIVKDQPYFDGQKTTFTLQTEMSSPYKAQIRAVCLFKTGFLPGDTVFLRGDLKPPIEPGNPGDFDFRNYLAQQNIYYSLTVKHPQDSRILKVGTGFLAPIYEFRDRAEDSVRHILPEQEASILLGMLLGGRAGIEDELYQDFQKTGIIHLLSVGGLHIGFLLLLVGWLNALAKSGRRHRFWSGVIVLLLYGTMTGWPIPVIRAVIMALLGLAAYYSGRDSALLNVMAISGLLILAADPRTLFSISFQLTMMATWGLVYVFPRLRKQFPVPNFWRDLVLLPIAVELAVSPVVAYYFSLFSPVSILTNILVTYLAGAAVIMGFMALLLLPLLPALAAGLLYPTGFCIEAIVFIVQQVKCIPWGHIWVATPHMGMILIYYAVLLALLLAAGQSNQRPAALTALPLLTIWLAILLLPAKWVDRGYLEIVFVDVGQGDAIVLKSPQGRFVLVDGGGSPFYDVGLKTVLPYLHRRGIRRLDMIINTHPDMDHLQGLESVAREMDFDYLGLPASLANRPDYERIKSSAQAAGSSVLALSSGQYISLENGLGIRVLGPEPEAQSGTQFNGESVVLEVQYGDSSVLLSGDITAVEMMQIRNEVACPLTIVKVPHHGSKGSLCPAFYQDLEPRVAVLSVGENNPFGHPAPAVLDLLETEGVKVFRTDRDGAIIFRSDGMHWSLNATRKTTI